MKKINICINSTFVFNINSMNYYEKLLNEGLIKKEKKINTDYFLKEKLLIKKDNDNKTKIINVNNELKKKNYWKNENILDKSIKNDSKDSINSYNNKKIIYCVFKEDLIFFCDEVLNIARLLDFKDNVKNIDKKVNVLKNIKGILTIRKSDISSIVDCLKEIVKIIQNCE